MLRRAAGELSTWKALPRLLDEQPRQLWVNVAASQLLEVDFVDRVEGLIEEFGLLPETLGVEVTEETLATGSRHAPALLDELRRIGVALAIDDFGSWYSALGTLGELPIAAVKLDQPYVRGVGSDLENDTIVASVIALAHAHGVRVVAEGVESWSEGARLCELGCDRGNGLSVQRSTDCRTRPPDDGPRSRLDNACAATPPRKISLHHAYPWTGEVRQRARHGERLHRAARSRRRSGRCHRPGLM